MAGSRPPHALPRQWPQHAADAIIHARIAGNAVRLIKIRGGKAHTRGQKVVANLRGTSDTKMTTEEILALTRG